MKKNIAILAPHDDKFSSKAIIDLVNDYPKLNLKLIFLQKNFFKFRKKLSFLFIFNLNEIIKIIFRKKTRILSFVKDKKILIKFTKNINEKYNLRQISNKKIDYLIILSSNNILGKEILRIKKLKIINFHTSKLPKYRGVLPIFRAYMNNEKEIGFSIHEVNKNIDDGKILSQKVFKIKNRESILDLYDLAFKNFPSLVWKAINDPINLKNDVNNSTYFSYPNLSILLKFRINEISKKIKNIL